MIAQVPPLRELEALAEVPFTFISPEQFQAELVAEFDAENPPERVEADENLLKRMGLLGPEVDLRKLILELYGSQVAAFYRPDRGEFSVIERDDPFGGFDKIIVAHEYTHALQDQHFDLEANRITDPAEGDRALAQLALLEGDASLLMQQWALQHLTPQELLELAQGGLTGTEQQTLERMPPILRRQLTFPYFEGAAFVTQLQASGGWAAVNAAFGDQPQSTEQILHPEKYTDRDEPTVVTMPDAVADPTLGLGAGWTVSTQATLGEAQIQVWLADGAPIGSSIPGLPGEPPPNAESAAGWDGDRAVSYDGPNGAWAVAWQTVWDTPEDGAEFRATAEAVMADLAGVHGVLDASTGSDDPNGALVLIASDQATFDALQRSIPQG